MSRVYESLKETLQRSKSNPVTLARIKGNSALTVNDEMEDLEKIVLDRIGRLKAALKEGEVVGAEETQRADKAIENLNGNIAVLDARIREMDDTARKKDLAFQRMEENRTAKIHDLQNEVKIKEDALESRSNEINDLKSKIDGQVKQVAQLETAIQKVKAEAASQAKRADQVTESSKTKIAALEAQLRDAEETVRGKDSTLKGLEQNLDAKIQNFEIQLRDKEKLLAGRDVEINDLKVQLQLLTHGIKEMSSFFRQAEVLAGVEGQNGSTVNVTEPLNQVEETPAGGDVKPPMVTSNSTDPPQQTVSPNFFDRMDHELTQIVGPIASMIVRDHVAALGESIEKFPKARVGELLDTVSEEISDERQKLRFREQLAKEL